MTLVERISGDERAVSPIISTILLVAVTVILAATISVLVLGLGEDVENPGPNIAESTGEFTAGATTEDQVVKITHVAGDSVTVQNMEILIRAPDCNARATLVDLPGDGDNFRYTLADSNIEGDKDLIDQGPFAQQVNTGPIYADADDSKWDAGETIAIEIAVGGCDFRKETNTELDVLIRHTESNTVLIKQEFSA